MTPNGHGMGPLGHACIIDAWGVRPKAAPGGRDGRIGSIEVREIVAGETGRSKPPRRVSGGRCAGSRRQSCAARCRRRWRKCPHWCGHDCPARCGARCAAAPQERAHERSRHRRRTACRRDERGAERRREEDTAVTSTTLSNLGRGVSARHRRGAQRAAAASGARSEAKPSGGARDCSGNRSEAEIAAESPVAKRRAQTHRRVRHTANHLRHHRRHRLHHHRHRKRRQRMRGLQHQPQHHDRHRRPNQRRRRRR